MTRLMLVVAAAGASTGATWGVYPGAGTPIQDETCAAWGYDVCVYGDECP